MAQDSQPKVNATLGRGVASRATNIVIAATLAASMVPSAAFAAFQNEVYQGTEASALDTSDQVALQSANAEGDGASNEVVDALGEAVEDGDAALLGLDHANLPDGQYTVKLMMMHINGKQVSMSNGAVGNVVDGTTGQHEMTLDVVDGEYWLTMHWVPLESNLGGTPFVGYLANLAYFEDYSFTPYLKGTKVDAKVLSQYVNADGTPVYDDYNRPGSESFVGDNVYPKDVQIKISGAALEDGMQPVHVFVPVMDAIASGTGDQNAYVKLFWNSLSVSYLTTDKTALKSSLDTAKALEQGKKSNDAWKALKSAISTAQGVYDNAAATQDSVNAAATALDAAVKTFQDSADTGADAASDPFDGVIDDGPFYVAAQKCVDESGNAIASADAAFNQNTLNIRRVDAAEGRYEVKLQTRYALPAGPVITSVSYEAADNAARSAKMARKVRDDVNNVGYHTVEWRIYVDDLSQQQKLNVQYTVDGEAKTQTLFITPLKADAKLGTAMEVLFQGTADYYRTNNYLDATGLFLAIEDARALEQGKKSNDAWNALQDAITAAQTVYDNTSKQQDDCDSAVATLKLAVDAFNASPNDASATFGMEAGVWYTNSTEGWSGTKQGIGDTTPFDTQSARYKLNDDGTFTVRVKTYGKLYYIDQVACGSPDQAATKTGQWNTGLGYKGPETMWDFTVSDLSQVTVYVSGKYQNGTTLTAEPFALTIAGLSAGGDGGFAKAAVQLDDGDLYQAWARGKALSRDSSRLDAWQQLQSALSVAEGVRSQVTTSMKNGTESVSQSDIDAATQRVNEAIDAYEAPLADPRYGMEPGVFYCHLRLNDQVDAESASGVIDAPLSIGKSTFRVADDGTFEVTLACPEVSGASGAAVSSIKVGATDSEAGAAVPQQIGGGAGTALYRFMVDSLAGGIYAWMTYTDASGATHSNVRFHMTLDLSATDGGYGFTRLENQDDTKKDLYAQIVEAKAVERGKKSDSAWNALQAAIETAEGVYAQVNPEAGANTAAAATLQSAVDAFDASPDEAAPSADKSALADAIAKAEATSQGNKKDSAWDALQSAIAKAKGVYGAADASQADVDAAASELTKALSAFNASADVSPAAGLDFDNLENGTYTVRVDMYQVSDRTKKSMSDQAINHQIELTVKNGDYYLTFDFQGLRYLGKFGYLGWMKYYDEGFTYSQYGSPVGSLSAATVLSTQKNADGTDVYDEFNTDGSQYKLFSGLYPDKIRIEYVQSARDDADGYIPLQVFVPVMESIAAGNGTQDVLAKVDKSSIKEKTTASIDASELQALVASAENALATSKKADEVNAKLQKAVDSARAVLSRSNATQSEVDAAVAVLESAIREFNAAPDVLVADKTALADAIAKAKALAQGNKTDSAWEALQAAIAKAEGVAADEKATQTDVDAAAAALDGAVATFNASADKPAAGELDFANLPAGTYSIAIDMYKMNRTDKSMSDAAINHTAKLTVDDNGDYWITFDFASVKSGTTNGYLGSLSYYDEGYAYNGAKVLGSLVAGTVIDYQTGVDGKQYPNHVTVKFVKTARNDANRFIPLQVFVPVMEEIAEDCGTQDVLAKYDPQSVQKLDGDIPDQVEPGVNGNGPTGGSGTITTTGPATVSKATATPTTAAKSAVAGSALNKTGDATAGLLSTAIAGMTAAAVAAGCALRRRFGKPESEE